MNDAWCCRRRARTGLWKRRWVLGPNNYYGFARQQPKPEDTTIPSTELAKQVIEYAQQLEMIV
ncbi:26S proteasome non-ATPase regulatory subunit 8 [Saguinus oedipus]|uniref:26S proteasome non-ATPase regulatory subunit 8 n=1 Tax=Saguinus oedipus TaxID=9490 RepID=A0ABQ9U4E6_SAGOE|nr:26S proteasome non-ATPase regulatory subunit 8 [Saguinus oedipus]